MYDSLNENNCDEIAYIYAIGESSYARILGTRTGVDIESDSDSYRLLNSLDNKVIVLIHNHPTDNSFSIEDFSQFLLYGKMKVMVAVTNSGNLHIIVKNKNYDRSQAIKSLIRLTTE